MATINPMKVEVEITIKNMNNKTMTDRRINIDGVEYSLTPVKNELNIAIGDMVSISDNVGNSTKMQLKEVEWENMYNNEKTTYTFVHYEKN